jgi:hypothetical protein
MDTSTREHNSDVTHTVVKSVLRRLIGSAIVARVRANPRIRYVLLEAVVIALVTGIVGYKLIGIPIWVCFVATLLLFAEAVLQVHFASVHALYREWTTFRRKSYLTFGIVMFVHMLVADALQIATPAEVYAEVVRLGGFRHMFLHNTATKEVLLAMCLDLLLLMASVPAVFEKSRKAWRQLLVVTAIAVLLILKPINWRAVDECFATRGLIPCVFGYMRDLLVGR